MIDIWIYWNNFFIQVDSLWNISHDIRWEDIYFYNENAYFVYKSVNEKKVLESWKLNGKEIGTEILQGYSRILNVVYLWPDSYRVEVENSRGILYHWLVKNKEFNIQTQEGGVFRYLNEGTYGVVSRWHDWRNYFNGFIDGEPRNPNGNVHYGRGDISYIIETYDGGGSLYQAVTKSWKVLEINGDHQSMDFDYFDDDTYFVSGYREWYAWFFQGKEIGTEIFTEFDSIEDIEIDGNNYYARWKSGNTDIVVWQIWWERIHIEFDKIYEIKLEGNNYYVKWKSDGIHMIEGKIWWEQIFLGADSLDISYKNDQSYIWYGKNWDDDIYGWSIWWQRLSQHDIFLRDQGAVPQNGFQWLDSIRDVSIRDRGDVFMITWVSGYKDIWVVYDGQDYHYHDWKVQHFSFYEYPNYTVEIERQDGEKYTEGVQFWRDFFWNWSNHESSTFNGINIYEKLWITFNEQFERPKGWRLVSGVYDTEVSNSIVDSLQSRILILDPVEAFESLSQFKQQVESWNRCKRER